MKRFFILASAAIVALASCAKTQVVYNDAPEEIAFKQITNVMTKAATLGDQAHTTMGVYADITGGENYFSNVSFAPDQYDNNYWVANPKQYWPLGDDKLNFAVYAPWNNSSGVISWDKSTSKLSIKVNNSTFGSQTDWLYGKGFYSNVTKDPRANDVVLRHALAKIIVNVSSDLSGLKIVSLQITDTEQNETMTVDYAGSGKDDNNYTDGDARVSWTNTGDPVDMTILSNVTFDNTTDRKSAFCYVIPSAQTTINLTYKLTESATEKTYTHDLTTGSPNWYGGYKYTYNIQIAANEIKFNPSVDDWTDGEGATQNINPNTSSNIQRQ